MASAMPTMALSSTFRYQMFIRMRFLFHVKHQSIQNQIAIPKWVSQGTAIPIDCNTETYFPYLETCTDMEALKQAHGRMLIAGLNQNIVLGTKLVSMYCMWGCLENARLIFDKIYEPNVFLFNAMIRGYARNGLYEDTLAIYYQMQRAGVQPDRFTFPVVLKACAGLSALQEGKEVHYHILKTGFDSDAFVGATLIDMYAKCGSLEDARQVFDKMSTRDVVSWTAIIAGYAQNGYGNEALELFQKMQLAHDL